MPGMMGLLLNNLAFQGARGGGGGLPMLIDFTALSDGALPDWQGGNWSIVSGRPVCTPTMGASLFQPGADTFGSGTYSWSAVGNNTIENDAGELKVTYVDNSQGAILELSAAKDLVANLAPGAFYVYQVDTRINTGNYQLFIYNALTFHYYTVSDTVMATKSIVFQRDTATQVWLNSMGAGEIVWLDNQSLAQVTGIFGAPSANYAQVTGDVVVRVALSGLTVDGQERGIFLCCDDLDNPQNYVLLTVNLTRNKQLRLVKVINGGAPQELYSSAVSAVEGAYLELRRTGNTFQGWYNKALKAEVTITDASIVDNTLHGILATGNANMKSLFIGQSVIAFPVGYIGGSITWMPGYKEDTIHYMQDTHLAYDILPLINAANGQVAWEELARLQQGVFTETPNAILIDLAANHLINSEFEDATIEALVRYLRAMYPGAYLVMPIFGVWSTLASTTTLGSNTTRRAQLVALCEAYDVDYVDVGAQMEADIANGHTLAEWYTFPDLVHPNTAGHAYIANLLSPLLTLANLLGGASQWTGDLGDYPRIEAASEYYDGAYQLVNGVDNDGETGTGWTTTLTTARTSSVADDTISFTGTFRSFGLYHTRTGQIAWSIDGEAYSSTINLATTPRETLYLGVTDYALHTVTFKVVSGAPVFRQFVAI